MTSFRLRPVFGVPGDDVTRPYLRLAEEDELVRTTREDAAVYAAIGAAEVSGEPAAALATCGPGVAVALAGLACALADRVPVLCATGEITERGFQSLVPSMASDGVELTVTDDPEEAARTLARSEPVLYVDPGFDPDGVSAELEDIEPVEPDPEDVERVRGLLEGKRVAILVGRGCYRARCGELVERLCEVLEAPIVETMRGRGVVPEYHPRNAGVVGLRGWANDVVEDADVVLALGARLSGRTRADIDWPTTIAVGFGVEADEVVECDVRAFVKALLENPPRTEPWNPKPGEPPEFDLELYRVVKAALKAWIGPATVDSGQITPTALLAARLSSPSELIHSGSFCPMGFAIPAALGASARVPEMALALTGDGGFMASCQELETAVREDLPIAVLVTCNGELGFTRQVMEEKEGRATKMGLDVDVPSIAESLGAEVEVIGKLDPGEVKRVLRDVEMKGETTVVVVELPREDVPMPGSG
ncbi:thiamine pyrophosphate-dependent enzyme [Methanopyrus kandleri]